MQFNGMPLVSGPDAVTPPSQPAKKEIRDMTIHKMSSEEYQQMLREIVCTGPKLYLTSDNSAFDMLHIATIVQAAPIQVYKVPLIHAEGDTNPVVRGHHATMHCARTTLWTLVFSALYELILQ